MRSTPDIPGECDVLALGAGMAGITTAYYVLEGGKSSSDVEYSPLPSPSPSPSVVVLEARQLCSGATARNGGHCKIKVPTLVGKLPSLGGAAVDELHSYVRGVMDGLKRLVEDEELLDYCEFELRRTFDVFLGEREGKDEGEGRQQRQQQGTHESEDLKRTYNERRRAGDSWTQHVGWIGERYAEQVTSVHDAVAAFNGPACSFWPYKLAVGLLARLVARYPPPRLNVQTHTTVTAITTTTDVEGNIWNVASTSRGAVRARRLVFATNAYTAGLLPQFEGSIVPIRGMASHITPAPVPIIAKSKGDRKEGEVVVGVDTGVVHPHLNNTYNISFGPERGVDYLNPRPDGGIVVGGGQWKYNDNRSAWYDNFDDSERFGPDVEAYWDDYMQRTFHGWERSRAAADSVWVGIMGITPDGWPHVGRVPGGGERNSDGANNQQQQQQDRKRQQWMLAGFNGGAMALILTAAKAVAKMVRDDVGFEQVREEFRLPAFFATSEGRLGLGSPPSVKERSERK